MAKTHIPTDCRPVKADPEFDGFVGVYDWNGDGDATSILGPWNKPEDVPTSHDGHRLLGIIVLSTITKDQLVQPNPEPKKVKGWVNVYAADREGYERGVIWPTRERADATVSGANPRIACIEVEFVEGQGLGDDS